MLTYLPPPILERIASCLSTASPAVPPSDLPALLCCNKLIYERLNVQSNPHLYARIFEATFDVQAIRRRRRLQQPNSGHAHVRVTQLAHELINRWRAMKRFRRRVMCTERMILDGDLSDEEVLRTDLWTAFIMFSENDGLNAAVLMRYARIDTFALQCIRPGGVLHSNSAEVHGGWTEDNEINALLGWIFWFTDSDRVPSESIEQRDEIIQALTPVYVGSFKYPLPHAPLSFFYPPSHPHQQKPTRRIHTTSAPAYTLLAGQNPSIHQIPSLAVHPPCLVTSPALIAPDAQSSLPLLARPLLVPPIIASYVARQELQFLRWPSEPSGVPAGSRAPATREEARLAGWTGPTGEDYLWFRNVRTKRVELGAGFSDSDNNVSSAENERERERDDTDDLSRRWDIDWARLRVCFNPFDVNVPRDRFQSRMRVYEPGMLDGVWDGRWLMMLPNEFHMLLHETEQGRPLDPDFWPALIQTPMTFRLKEHHSFMSNPDRNLPYDDTGPGALRAWIPENTRFVQDEDHLNIYEDTDRPRYIGTYETFNPYESHSVRRRKAMERVSRHGTTFRRRSFGREGDAMEVDYESFDDAWDDEDNDESLFGHGVWDIIITAETEPYFAKAWTLVSFRGRIRPWDGLVVLERMPANGTGRWIFRGYLHGGVNLVGRWRETGTQFDASGWEGAWVVGRRA